MLPRYGAFLPRFWRRDDGSQRIEIEHIQAGTRGVVATPAAALARLADHADDVAAARQPEGGHGWARRRGRGDGRAMRSPRPAEARPALSGDQAGGRSDPVSRVTCAGGLRGVAAPHPPGHRRAGNPPSAPALGCSRRATSSHGALGEGGGERHGAPHVARAGGSWVGGRCYYWRAERRRLRGCHGVAMGRQDMAQRAKAGVAPSRGVAVTIRLLGGFRVSVGDRVVEDREWRLLKARALVKLLALAPRRRLAREQAMEALWPAADAAASRRNLAYALHVARRALDRDADGDAIRPSLLLLEGGLLSLDVPGGLRVDADEFGAAAEAALAGDDPRAYRAALALYGGELLPDDRYEDWATGARERLGALAQALRHGIARQHEAAGEPQEAAAALAAAVGAEPADEAAHVALMRLYARGGQRTRALAQFRTLRDTLRRELDTEPGTESQRLYAAILAGRPAAGRDLVPARPPAARPERHNLPAPTTTLFGREAAIAAVCRALDAARLVTLAGAGGVGKTRLALAAGWALAGAADRPAGGVWLLDLAALRDGTLLPGLLAAALGLRGRAAETSLEAVVATLHDAPSLIILDNCEHLIAPCADFAVALLARCSRLRVLATSREALRATGELVWRVPSLALPAIADERSAADALDAQADSPAARLFVDRARLARADFVPTPPDAGAIAAICRRLDGIPLAIELAAARIAVLTPTQLAARLDDALRVLTAGPRTAPLRHQTLRATLAWSHRLLAPAEQTLLARLAVFAGGWTLAAAESVCDLGEATLDLLAALVDKSLVQVEVGRGADEPRYHFLETVRQFAAEHLAASGQEATCRARHADYFLHLAEEAALLQYDGRQNRWLARELGNMRGALGWYAASAEAEAGLRLAGALGMFWRSHDHATEGWGWLNRAFATGGAAIAPAVRARAHYAAAMIADFNLGDYATAREQADLALALYREVGDEVGVCRALVALGKAARGCGALTLAREHLEAALALARTLAAASRAGEEVVSATVYLAAIALDEQRHPEAIALYGEALPLARAADQPRLVATAASGLVVTRLLRGETSGLRAPLAESMRIFREIGDIPSLAMMLGIGAMVALAEGDPFSAVRLVGASDQLRAAHHLALTAIEAPYHAQGVAAARAALGESDFARAYAAGRALPVEEITDVALAYLAG